MIDSSRPVRLPADTRLKMESVFGADLAALRICVSDLLPIPGVAALTCGSTIHCSSSFYSPGTLRGDAILAHEIAHALQQQRLSLRSREPVLLIRPDLELEAHAWACLAMLEARDLAAFASRPGSAGRLDASWSGILQPWIMMAKTTDDPESYGKPSYQPKLRFGNQHFRPEHVERGKPYDEEFYQLQDVESAWRSVSLAWRFLYSGNPPSGLKDLLRRWIGVGTVSGSVLRQALDTGYKLRSQEGVWAEFRYYHTYGELTSALWKDYKALVGGALTEERRVAIRVLRDNQFVLYLLRQLASKVAAFLGLEKGKLGGFLDKPAAYGPLHGRTTFADVVAALCNPGKESAENLIALLHDAKDLCGLAKLIDTSETPFKLKTGAKVLTITKYSSRYNVGTVDEADDWVLWMREKGRAVWAGPSYTMINMWRMAAAAGASSVEMEAMGYAMFAYWNYSYPRFATPIHRFHETMAGSHMFGIPYRPDLEVEGNYSEFLFRAMQSLPHLPHMQLTAKL